MKYDLIVCGAGPAGVTAALTAAGAGLKVCLVDRKKDIAQVNRLCGQFTNINMTSVSGREKYGYSEALNLEIGTRQTRVTLPDIGFSFNYEGPIRPYLNYIHLSPSGYRIYREKDRFIGYHWDKSSLLASLLKPALKAGVELITETVAESAENTAGGLVMNLKSGERPYRLEAAKAIDALGHGSSIAESIGLGQRRLEGVAGTAGYILENVETELRLDSWLCFTVPEAGRSNFWMYLVKDGRNVLGGGGGLQNVDKLMKMPAYAPWFRNARVVGKTATSGPRMQLRPHQEPVKGNVLVAGEAAGAHETSNPGAIACGYQAAMAVKSELEGKSGFKGYVAWWQNAFECVKPIYLKAAARFGVLNELCSNDEVDFVYRLLGDHVGVPSILISKNMELIRQHNPELYTRLKQTNIDLSLEEFAYRPGAKSAYSGS
jgi:flavin-dependent dehydrogenase